MIARMDDTNDKEEDIDYWREGAITMAEEQKLRTHPYVQTRVHSICKQFRPDEMYYIKSKLNPADLGTKFDKFHRTYEEIGDDSLFRKGPAC